MAQAGVIRDFLVALGFQTDNAGLAKMQGAMAGVELKAKALNLALMSLATGAVIAVRQTASELDKLYFSSQRIGASATNITAFGNAISQMGGNAESALGTLEGLAEKMRNSPGYEGMLNGLGVSTKEANGDNLLAQHQHIITGSMYVANTNEDESQSYNDLGTKIRLFWSDA